MKLLSLVCLIAVSSLAETYYVPSNAPPRVALAWDASACTNVITNYSVYFGVASRSYTNRVLAGTNLTVTVSNLVRGVTYYFAATAQDNQGLESDFSSEVSYAVPDPPASPGLHPPIVLTVQAKAGLTNAWADAGMNWTLSPEQEQQYFRLRIAGGAKQGVSLAMPKVRPKQSVPLPPIPAR